MVNGVFSLPLDAYGPASRIASKDKHPPVALRHFVGSPENALALAAADSLLEAADSLCGAGIYNPLTFFGPSGTGKTMLARG